MSKVVRLNVQFKESDDSGFNEAGKGDSINKTKELVKDSVDECLLPNGDLSYEENIRLVEESFKINGFNLNFVEFRIGNVFNNILESPGFLKIIVYAASITNLTVGETLLLFGERYKSVLKNRKGYDERNIRELLKFPKDAMVSNLVSVGLIEFSEPPLTKK